MKGSKALLALVIVGLLLGVGTMSGFGLIATKPKVSTTPAYGDYYVKILSVNNGDVTYIYETITEAEYNDVMAELDRESEDEAPILSRIESLRYKAEDYYAGHADKNDVAESANAVCSLINDAVPEEYEIDRKVVAAAAEGETGAFVPSLIISGGFAASTVLVAPEEPEAFLGLMFTPISTVYEFGYTGVLMFPLIRLSYKDRAVDHSVTTIGFAGIYMDIGKLGLGMGSFVFYAGISLFNGLSPQV